MSHALEPHERIAVIGGGAAGLHAAWLLRERGYTDVPVFERRDRIGGKSHTVRRGGIPHELGTCYLHPGYAEIKRLLAATGATREIKPGGPDGDRDIYSRELTGQLERPLRLGEWMLGAIEQATFPKALWWAPDRLQAGNLVLAIQRYKLLHRRIFGHYEGSLPPRPVDDEAWDELDGTFGELLRRHRLEALRPLVTLSSSAMGYGLVDTVPALYGLWWNTPALLDAFLASGRDPDQPVLTMLQDGFGALWEKVAEPLDLRLGHAVERVVRGDDGVRISGTGPHGPFTERADRLIVAIDAGRALDLLDADDEERDLFEGMTGATLVTHLVSVDHVDSQCITYWPDRLRVGLGGRLYSVRDGRKCLLPGTSPPDGRDDLVTYQYFDRRVSRSEVGALVERRLVEDLEAAGYTGIEIHEQHVWPYFTRFTQDGVNRGRPWALFARQGCRRTWFLGGSACFESVHDITTYTRQVLDPVTVSGP